MPPGRRTKYTPEMHAEIVRLLAAGCLVHDICARVGINPDTYFKWINKYPDFSDAVTRAKAEANTYAVEVIRTAMSPHDTVSKTLKSYSETRLRKGKDGEQEPYTYAHDEKSTTVMHEMGDWRAALEFLKRRDPENWTDRQNIDVTSKGKEIKAFIGFSPDEWKAEKPDDDEAKGS